MHEKKKKMEYLWITFLVVLLFTALNIFTPFSNITKGALFSITSPVQRVLFERGGAFQKITEVLQDAKKAEAEIDRLRRENFRLSARLGMQGDVQEENEALRKALELELSEEKERVFAEVIGKDMSRHHIIIRHQEKIDEGDLAVSPEGSLVGVVSDIYEGSAKIKLITSKKSSFEAKVQNDDKPIGLLKGDSDGLFLDLLPKEKEIKEEDIVVSLPQGIIGIGGIYIGTVDELIYSDVEAFAQAKIRPGFDIRYLDFLFIIKK